MTDIQSLSQHLLRAYETGVGVAPLTELDPTLNIDEAYRIQLDFVADRLEKGHHIVGKKSV